jgi:ribosome-binding protein aMBF1 (putative translation factor)
LPSPEEPTPAARVTRRKDLQRDEYTRLREVVGAELERQGISERQASHALGWDYAVINKIMRGERTIEYLELVDLARYLHLSPTELVRRATE